jgi:hypothetical protein
MFCTYHPKQYQRFPIYPKCIGLEVGIIVFFDIHPSPMSAAMTAISSLPMHYAPVFMELTAEEVTPNAPSWMQSGIQKLRRCTDTMAFRIAVPPMAIWAVLYSLVEYMM